MAAADVDVKPNVTVEDADDDSDDMPELTDATADGAPAGADDAAAAGADDAADEAGGADKPKKMSRVEKKARKTVQKLGLKPVPNIVRVTFKQGKDAPLFAITNPDVFRPASSSGAADAYVVFGAAAAENAQENAATQAAQAYAHPDMAQFAGMGGAMGGAGAGGDDDSDDSDDMPALTDANDAAAAGGADAPAGAPSGDAPAADATAGAGADGALDESGVEPTDIDLVMSQTSVTRAQAVQALKQNKGDIVNAIMSLTL